MSIGTFIIIMLSLLSVCSIAYGMYSVYRYLYIGYHIKVSDTDTPYLRLRFANFTDELEIYSADSGRQIYLKCIHGDNNVYSKNYTLPDRYENPYDYVMSGNLDKDITHLRVAVDIKAASAMMVETSHFIPDNQAYLEQQPIKFHDVGDEIRKRLRLGRGR